MWIESLCTQHDSNVLRIVACEIDQVDGRPLVRAVEAAAVKEMRREAAVVHGVVVIVVVVIVGRQVVVRVEDVTVVGVAAARVVERVDRGWKLLLRVRRWAVDHGHFVFLLGSVKLNGNVTSGTVPTIMTFIVNLCYLDRVTKFGNILKALVKLVRVYLEFGKILNLLW